MIEVKDAVLSNYKAMKDPFSFVLNSGQLNIINASEKYKFDLLKLKNIGLEKGEFLIDGIKVFPNESEDQTLFFLAVNSLIKIGLCFVCKKEEKQQKVKDVQSKLVELRSLPTETEDDKQNKILQILQTSCSLSPSYMLIDYNDETNKTVNLSYQFLEQFVNDTVVVIMEKIPVGTQATTRTTSKSKNVDNDYFETSISIGEDTVLVEERPTQYQNEEVEDDFIQFDIENKNNFFKFFGKTFKNNAPVFLAFGVPVIGVIAFALLTPLYFNSSNKWLLIPFILTVVICFVLHLIMTFKCTMFVANKNDPLRVKKMLVYLSINSLVSLVGAALGVGIFLLFKNFDNDLKQTAFNKLYMIAPILLGLIMMTENLFVAYIGKAIIKLFKKRK